MLPGSRINAIVKPTEQTVWAASSDSLITVYEADSGQVIQKLKGILAHKNPNLQLSELIDQLCDLGLEKWDKSLPAPARVTKKSSQEQEGKTQSRSQVESKANVRRDVWIRDNGKCQICGSQYAIELDHRIPKSLGGGNTADNLRLLCRSCNQREAIEALGMNQMDKFINAEGNRNDFDLKKMKS